MSSDSLIREPAWGGLRPQRLDPGPLEVGEAADILAAAGVGGRVRRLLLDRQHLGFYRLDADDGRRLFVKVTGAGREASVQCAEDIARWLASRGLRVCEALPGFPRRGPGGGLVVVSEYLDGRWITATMQDLDALGAGLASLHRVLDVHPDRAQWVARTAVRMEGLCDMRERLARGDHRAGPEPEALRSLAADRTLDFWPHELPAHVLHGDLNPGNVLLVGAPAEPVFLDFEDVFHSVLPTLLELLLVLERHVLVPIDDDAEALRLGRALLDSYRRGGGRVTSGQHPPANLLRGLSLRSLCVLAQGEARGINVAAREWHKFLQLAERAGARGELVARMFDSAPI